MRRKKVPILLKLAAWLILLCGLAIAADAVSLGLNNYGPAASGLIRAGFHLTVSLVIFRGLLKLRLWTWWLAVIYTVVFVVILAAGITVFYLLDKTALRLLTVEFAVLLIPLLLLSTAFLLLISPVSRQAFSRKSAADIIDQDLRLIGALIKMATVILISLGIPLTIYSSSQKEVSASFNPDPSILSQRKEDALVFISGFVVCPGAYLLPGNARVTDAINQAQGLAPGANPKDVNFSQPVENNMQIYVPGKISVSK